MNSRPKQCPFCKGPARYEASSVDGKLATGWRCLSDGCGVLAEFVGNLVMVK